VASTISEPPNRSRCRIGWLLDSLISIFPLPITSKIGIYYIAAGLGLRRLKSTCHLTTYGWTLTILFPVIRSWSTSNKSGRDQPKFLCYNRWLAYNIPVAEARSTLVDPTLRQRAQLQLAGKLYLAHYLRSHCQNKQRHNLYHCSHDFCNPNIKSKPWNSNNLSL